MCRFSQVQKVVADAHYYMVGGLVVVAMAARDMTADYVALELELENIDGTMGLLHVRQFRPALKRCCVG